MVQTMFSNRTAEGTTATRDGFQEQVQLLSQISSKLDEYFAMRSFGDQE